MITAFKGKYDFLSNFCAAPVYLDNFLYPTVEHAFQASKTLIVEQRTNIAMCKSPVSAKHLGKKVTLRHDWEMIKLHIMLDLLRQKFQEPKMKAALLATGQEELIEGNWWNDTFWGVCKGVGQNHLGKLLMKVRSELENETIPAIRQRFR